MDLTAVTEFEKFHLEDFTTDSTSANPNRDQSRGIWFNIPEPIDSFCGREDFLSQLHDQLKPRDDSETEVTVLSQVKIVSGLGGIGKTQTARKYITKQQKFYNNFIWIDAETENSLRNSFLKLANEIKIPIKNPEGNPREMGKIVNEIYNKICVGGKSNLIVFDNAEDFQSCKNFFPFGLDPDLKKPVILATSRNQDWISPTGKVHVLPLDKMTENESREFISKQLEIPESEIPEFREEAKEFIELIGGLPLALQQAVAYIKQEKKANGLLGRPYKMSDYVQEFKSSARKLQSFAQDPDSSSTVFITWDVTLNKIKKDPNGSIAIELIEVMSFLYADKIPIDFLFQLLRRPQKGINRLRNFFRKGHTLQFTEADLAEGLNLLEKFSMLKMTGNFVSLHRQVQFVILENLKSSGRLMKTFDKLLEKCSGILKDVKRSQSGDILNVLILHQFVQNLYEFGLIPMTLEFLVFMDELGGVLSQAGRYSESLDVYIKIGHVIPQLFGENSQEALAAQHEIAVQLKELGRHDEALTLLKEILKRQEIHLGVGHQLTAATKHNIAAVLQQQQKKYKTSESESKSKSLELLQELLAQKIKVLGENHPDTLVTQNNVAAAYFELDRFAEALTLFEELERKQTEIFGPDHEHVLTTKNNMASIFYTIEQFEEAFKIFNEVHEKKKEILGENHEDTIETLEMIGRILEQQGKLEQALEIYQKLYEGRKMNLGEEHPSTIQTKHKKADVLRQQKKYDESLEMLQQVFAQRTEILGETHPKTLSTLNLIAVVQAHLGHFPQALATFQDIEKKETETLGPQHPDVLITKINKATLLNKMGQLGEAPKIFIKVQERPKEGQRQRPFGENDKETLGSQYRMAINLVLRGRFDQALTLYKQILEQQEADPDLGPDHPNTIATKQNIANVLRGQEKYGEALEMFQQLLAQRNKIHGENGNHPDPEILKTQHQIALLHSKLGNFPQALTVLEDIEKKQIETLGPDHEDVFATKQSKAIVLYEMGQFDEASKILHEVHEKRKEILGGNHSDTIDTREWIARTLKKEGKLLEALEIHTRVREMRKKDFGEDHPDTIEVKNDILNVESKRMHKLGGVLYEASRYSESLDVYKKLHSKLVETLGENHEETLGAQSKMAMNLVQLARHEEASALLKQVLEKQQLDPDLGHEHPETIITRQNLAIVLQQQGKSESKSESGSKSESASLELLQQILAERTKILGENHPDTLTAQNSIAVLHSNLGNFSQASAFFQDLETKIIKIAGPHHREVLRTKQNRAGVLFKMGEFEEAAKIFNHVYEKRKEILGENHPDTIETFASIGTTLEKQGKLEQALQIYQKVYEIRKAELGEDHPDTFNTKYNMADVLRQQEKYQKSLEMFQQVLKQRSKILGENHPKALSILNTIAVLHAHLGDFPQAVQVFEYVEKKETEILGPDHEDALVTRQNKAAVLKKAGDFEAAAKIFNQVYEKRKEILGENHPCTIDTLEWIGTTLEQEGKFKEALDIHTKVYEMRKVNLGEDHPDTIRVKNEIVDVESKIKSLSKGEGE